MTDFFIFKVLNKLFSNPLIIDQVKTKKITTVKEVWIPDHNKHRFWRFYFCVYSSGLEKIYQTLETVFHRLSKYLEFRQIDSAAHRIFNSLLGVWIYQWNTVSRVSYITWKNAMDPPCVCRAPWLVKKNRATHFIQSARGFQLSLLLYNIHAIPHKARLRCRCWWEK